MYRWRGVQKWTGGYYCAGNDVDGQNTYLPWKECLGEENLQSIRTTHSITKGPGVDGLESVKGVRVGVSVSWYHYAGRVGW